MQLNVKGLGLAFGVTLALIVFVLGLTAQFLEWGGEYVDLMGTMYLGYEATIVGSVIGAIWGFIEGYIIGALLAYFYNKFS